MTSTITPTVPPPGEHTFHGRQVWSWGEDGDMGFSVEGHGLRALAAANAYGRDLDGPAWRRAGWAGHGGKLDIREHWVLVIHECGCTAEQHAQHRANDTDCDCDHAGLPPCDPERYAWTVDYVEAGTSGAYALTEVRW